MAFDQKWIDRHKAVGFYRHVEWVRKWGVLVKVFDAVAGKTAVSFEAVTMDFEYDQRVGDCRQFFLFRQNTVKFMLNMGLQTEEIITAFRRIDGCQIVYHYMESSDDRGRQGRLLG